MKEADFEKMCSGMFDGSPERTDVPYVLNNLFYERFGMSYREMSDLICNDKS
jgi:hypothetical protein